MLIRIQTASRLHFGMLSFPIGSGDRPTAAASHSHRVWGGAGMMIEKPGTEISVRPSSTWQARGPASERVLASVKSFLLRHTGKANPSDIEPLCFQVDSIAPQHQGLGTGTQLALAVARILAEACRLPDKSAVALAHLVGRGRRSAIGIHGFDSGGFLVEAGKNERSKGVSPLIARVEFPSEWQIILIYSKEKPGLHGSAENAAFALLTCERTSPRTDDLCSMLLLGMLPALHERDFEGFGETLYEFNRRVGEIFRSVQGGVYADPRSAGIVEFLRKEKVRGVGQSSWGPTLFAVVEDDDQGRFTMRKLRQRFGLASEELLLTFGVNEGAAVHIEEHQ